MIREPTTKDLKYMCSAWLGDREDPSLLKESGVNPSADYFLEEAEIIMQKVYEYFNDHGEFK